MYIMKPKNKRRIIIAITVLSAMGLCCCGILYYYLLSPQFHTATTSYIYIDRDDTCDSILHKLKRAGDGRHMTGFSWLSSIRSYPSHIHTGKYAIHPQESAYQVFRRLYRGEQTPVNLTISSTRTLGRLIQHIGKQLMADSADIASLLDDTLTISQMGYNHQTIPCLFIPNTYQVYWDISPQKLLERMQTEHNRFWNKERRGKAAEIGLSPEEIVTLASIVEEETNNNQEKPMVAGLYLNRLRRGMLLQADPTVKFALQDFSLRRITQVHLQTDSPYNTYLYLGLPPGPIRIPTPIGIDAVLNYSKHNYLYMCAKEDFSGTHNFAASYSEHMRNARRYWKALNQRNIR